MVSKVKRQELITFRVEQLQPFDFTLQYVLCISQKTRDGSMLAQCPVFAGMLGRTHRRL